MESKQEIINHNAIAIQYILDHRDLFEPIGLLLGSGLTEKIDSFQIDFNETGKPITQSIREYVSQIDPNVVFNVLLTHEVTYVGELLTEENVDRVMESHTIPTSNGNRTIVS